MYLAEAPISRLPAVRMICRSSREKITRACGRWVGRPAIFLMTSQSAPTKLGANLPKYRATFQDFRGSSQNFRTFGGLFHGFGSLTHLHGLNHWPAVQPVTGRNFRPARPTPDLVIGHKL